MSYELADGSLSTDYKVWDDFILTDEYVPLTCMWKASDTDVGDIVVLVEDDGSIHPRFSNGKRTLHEEWRCVIPTEETKQRARARKEKGMKQFAKDDLKDGMRVELRTGDIHYICGHMALHTKETTSGRLIYLDKFNHNLTAVSNNPMFDIIRVTDRDGTTLFEREEKRKVTFDLTE